MTPTVQAQPRLIIIAAMDKWRVGSAYWHSVVIMVKSNRWHRGIPSRSHLILIKKLQDVLAILVSFDFEEAAKGICEVLLHDAELLIGLDIGQDWRLLQIGGFDL